MATVTDLDRVNEYMMLQYNSGKMSDEVMKSWKSLRGELDKGFQTKNPTCCECGEKPGTHHYCHECYGNIQEVLNIVC